MGNLKDSNLEKLADKGNGHYAYIDSSEEAYRVLVRQMGSTLVTIAKDVKIQVDFNPAKVAAYRLIGYENRAMANEDFANDAKDAGEIGAGHHVTALYELVPAGKEHRKPPQPTEASRSSSSPPRPRATPRVVRRQAPVQEARCRHQPGRSNGPSSIRASTTPRPPPTSSSPARSPASACCCGTPPRRATSATPRVLELASPSLAHDPNGYRKEFVELVNRAKQLSENRARTPVISSRR